MESYWKFKLHKSYFPSIVGVVDMNLLISAT